MATTTPSHIVSVDDFDVDWLTSFFEKTEKIKRNVLDKNTADFQYCLSGKVIASLFYEPSTRTRPSFESAVHRLGGRVISIENAREASSAKKGEGLEDTIRVLGAYADAIILRHPETGAAARAANVSSVPIINAGDGTGDHPTQALLDYFTIREQFSEWHNLTLTMAGDLKNGRTVHSLLKLLRRLNHTKLGMVQKIFCVSKPALRLPRDISNWSLVEETDNFYSEMIERTDVLYLTRTQLERGSAPEDTIGFSVPLAEKLNPSAIILHPLPRNDELPPAIDSYPNARYFEQARNGLFIRMQLLKELLYGE